MTCRADDGLVGSPFQAPAFVAAWDRTRGRVKRRTPLLLLAETRRVSSPRCGSKSTVAALADRLLSRRNPANANGWRLRPGALAPALGQAALAVALGRSTVRIDAIELRRLPDIFGLGPDFEIRPAIEERFAIFLAGGLEAVLSRGNAKRKRKKFRSQQRFFEAHGGYVFEDACADARTEALATFFAQKRARFADLKMPNPFADAGIEAFLSDLFFRPEIDTRLYRIVSGGASKAMMGGIVADGIFWGMFSSFSDDADADVSPGELLLWHLVERLSAEGLDVLDLGPGEERYKRSWCDRVVPQYDATLALTPAGRAYVAAARLRGRVVFWVKSDVRLKRIVQQVRRHLRRD